MKKLFLLFSFSVSAIAGHAQLTLPATSPYSQNFDAIGSGLPAGWLVYSASTSTSLGNLATFTSSTSFGIYKDTSNADGCAAEVFAGGFKNYASADAGQYYATCAQQQLITNRALGVRQVSPTNGSAPNLDSGAAFVLELANTANMTDFNLSFKLQSLDSSSPRETTWMVDYAIGTPTNFIPATNVTGYWITGGLRFSDTTNTVNFGTALNNQNQHVYIRIVTLLFSSSVVGTGNRASTGIDDYQLSYQTTAGVANVTAQTNIGLTVLGAATSDNITLGYDLQDAGAYTVTLYDMTGRILYSRDVNAAPGTQRHNISGMHLSKGMYIAKMSNDHISSVAKVMIP